MSRIHSHCWPAARRRSWWHRWERMRLLSFVSKWLFWSLYDLNQGSYFTIRHTDRSLMPVSGDFSHIDSKISSGSLPDDPTAPGGAYGVFYSSSRTITFMDKLIESFNRIWHDLFKNAQQTNIFSGGVILDETAPKLHHACLTGWEKIITKE